MLCAMVTCARRAVRGNNKIVCRVARDTWPVCAQTWEFPPRVLVVRTRGSFGLFFYIFFGVVPSVALHAQDVAAREAARGGYWRGRVLPT